MARRTGPSEKVRRMVAERDHHACVLCGGTTGLQQHHRQPRRMGGSRRPWTNQPHNLLTVCAEDHARIESRRQEAMDLGYLLRDGDDPAQVPVHVYRPFRTPPGVYLIYLTADGGWQDPPLLQEPT